MDLEATGLEQKDLIIEIAFVPFDTATRKIEHSLEKHLYIKCPPFNELESSLNEWVKVHNKELIEKANSIGTPLTEAKDEITQYLESEAVKNYFDHQKITLFGKSMSAIDLPFMSRDFGWDWMRQYFEHRQQDLSAVAYTLIDMGVLPSECSSGSKLMNHLEMGEVCHTALEDAVNTAIMYLKLLDLKK
jgi:DNA polymerase-3 subunit epsilon